MKELVFGMLFLSMACIVSAAAPRGVDANRLGALYSLLDALERTAETPLMKRHLRSLQTIFQTEALRQTARGETRQAAREADRLNQNVEKCLNWLPDNYSFDAVAQGNNRLIFTFASELDHTLQCYALRLPKGFDPDRVYPLIVMLHGMGPSDMPTFISYEFNQPFNTERPNNSSVFVLEPFGRGNLYYQGAGETDVFEAIADVKKQFNVDEDRTYLTGQSMGGGGTWTVAAHTPDFWAAIAPCCPAFMFSEAPWLANNLAGVPVRFWYGEKDNPKYGENARLAHEALQAAGYTSEIHADPKAGHGVPAEEHAAIRAWLLQHTRTIPDTFSYTASEFPSYPKTKTKNRHWGRNGVYIQRAGDGQELPFFTCTRDGATLRIDTRNCGVLMVDCKKQSLPENAEIILNGKPAAEENGCILIQP